MPPKPGPDSDSQAAQVAARRALVCVADPSAAVQNGVQRLLQPLGAEVRRYATAAALLADLAAGAAPVAIIADTHLPDLPGLELLHELDRRGLKVPTILLTSEADVTSAVSLMRAGAIDYIEKPHVDRVLLGHLRHLLPGADPDRR